MAKLRSMLKLMVVEDNLKLRPALVQGLEDTGEITVTHQTAAGEEVLTLCLEERPDAVLMDVQLAGKMNGVEAAVVLRREFPRLPIVFYSIQDDDSYYRDFRQSGILSHYAYVRKTNYLLPHLIIPLLHDAISGRSYIDPEIESRVQEVRLKDESSPLDLLEPHEREVAAMLAAGLTNEQIASRMGYRDKRTISRVNGQIYTSWGLNDNTTDEKVARLRAALIYNLGRLIRWDEVGNSSICESSGKWVPLHQM